MLQVMFQLRTREMWRSLCHVLDVFLLNRDGRRGLREEEDGVPGRDDHLGEAVHRPEGAVSLCPGKTPMWTSVTCTGSSGHLTHTHQQPLYPLFVLFVCDKDASAAFFPAAS